MRLSPSTSTLTSLLLAFPPQVHASLTYAAARTYQCSHVIENLVREHFEGRKFHEFYEMQQKLGAGSYGSVYRAVHRQTGDEFACKVREGRT